MECDWQVITAPSCFTMALYERQLMDEMAAAIEKGRRNTERPQR